MQKGKIPCADACGEFFDDAQMERSLDLEIGWDEGQSPL